MQHRKFGMGQAPSRVEDARFITGQGHYATDARAEGQLVGHVLRATHASATFTLANLEAARAMPGVRLVLTHAEVAHLGALPCQAPVKNTDGALPPLPEYPVLPKDRVRHMGEALAFVVADTLEQAKDAAEAIAVRYSPLPVAATLAAARAEGAPLLHEACPGNIAFDHVMGEIAPTEAAFAKAARVVSLAVENPRLIANYMEPRSILAVPEAEGRITLTLGSQGVHSIRNTLAKFIFRRDPGGFRVITPDVGGGFGTKTFMYREYPLAIAAAEVLGRPVFWASERMEHFVACAHGRDNLTRLEMALDEKGRFLALRVHLDANMGAYLSQFGPHIPWVGSTMMTGVYDIPAGYTRLRGIYSHNVPFDAYRGAGRPEAAYAIERFVDFIADEIGMDRLKLRRLNFIKPRRMPYRTVTGRTYDSGDFAGHMARACALADWKGFERRAKAARKAGRLRGIGLATYIEACGGGAPDMAYLDMLPDGSVNLRIGTQSNGQGHATAYAQLVAQHLDLPLERIRLFQGDSDLTPTGLGTGASRSIPVGGAGVDVAARTMAQTLRDLAGQALEAAPADLEIAEGHVRIMGTDRSLDFAQIAALPQAQGKLATTGSFRPPEPTYPNGTHVAEVEIDPATGEARVVGYVIVDDVGATLNPTLLFGQIVGGAVQGLSQAVIERFVIDGRGQILTASLLDYALPRAEDLPAFTFETANIPCATNPLGIKGAGEAGTIGAAPAVMNAVVDALRRARGIRHLDMPVWPEKLWRALAS